MATKATKAEHAGASLICVGVIGAARGLKGEVRVKSFTAEPADIGAYGVLTDEAGKRDFGLRVIGRHKGQVVARIEGVADRTAAEALNGTRLFISRERLPKLEADEFYLADLVGLAARTEDGEPYGRVVLAEDYGAGPVLELELAGAEEGKKVMVAFTEAVVPEVDMEAQSLVIRPPEGLLEPPGPETGPEQEEVPEEGQ